MIGPAQKDQKALDVEIARLRDLDVGELRNRWQTVFRRRPPAHLSNRVLFRVLAYRIQAERFGDLDGESQRLLDHAATPEDSGLRAVDMSRRIVSLRPGTVLIREWDRRIYRVKVLADSYAWNGKAYPNLSKVAFAITGTRWSGPKFFGLRDKTSNGARS